MKNLDTQYIEHTITKVEDGKDYFFVTMSDGWSIGVEKLNGVEPKEGDTIRLYGKGIGCAVRGIDVNGLEVFYRTPEQEKERNRQEQEKADEEKKRKFNREKGRLDLEYDALPRAFQKRLDRFRANNPNFRWDLEDYEMIVCREAVNIANTLKTVDEIGKFREMRWEEQNKIVKALSDGHSGNTWGCACFLAECFVKDEKLVTMAHGAMCPLLGCKGYGCVPVE